MAEETLSGGAGESGLTLVDASSSDQSDRSGWSGRVGEGGSGWPVTGFLWWAAVFHNRGGSCSRTCPAGLLSPSDIAAGGQHCIFGLRHN